MSAANQNNRPVSQKLVTSQVIQCLIPNVAFGRKSFKPKWTEMMTQASLENKLFVFFYKPEFLTNSWSTHEARDCQISFLRFSELILNSGEMFSCITLLSLLIFSKVSKGFHFFFSVFENIFCLVNSYFNIRISNWVSFMLIADSAVESKAANSHPLLSLK